MPETAVAIRPREPESHPLPGGERLEAVLAAAAPFPDRARAEFFEPVREADGELRERVRRWLAEAAPGAGTARRLLAHRAATGRELGAGLRSVRLRDPRRLPDWAQGLVALLDAQPADTDADPVSGQPGSLFGAVARAGEHMLTQAPELLAGVELTPAAREQLVSTLGVRVWSTLKPAIEFELRLLCDSAAEPEAAALDVSLEGWLARMEVLPGIAHVVGVACHQWRATVSEIFGRLRADMPLLREALWQGADPGALAGFTGDAGDRHRDGRAVALLEFTSGAGVVYKPKDLTQTRAFLGVVEFMSARGLSLDLATRRILVRDGYSWEERVRSGPCADRGGFARFYRRFGMLTRLVQLLEGRDLWADNLLAAGEQPALIDLECLLYPRVTPPPTVSTRRGLLAELDDTVVRTGMIVQPWVPRANLPVRDLGCLSRAGDPVPGSTPLPLPPYRPWCREAVADPWCYGAEVLAGYREMQAALVRSREELMAPDGPLADFKGAEVRYIWRHTWECQNIVRASTGPRALRNGTERETVLARVLGDAYTMFDRQPDRADLAEIAEAEVEAFRRLDIPLFLSRTDSRSPYTPDGDEIAEHFQGDAFSRLLARVAELPTFPLEQHVSVISACLEAARNGDELAPPVPAGRAPRAPLAITPAAAEDLVGVAREIAEELLEARGQRDGWLGLSWYPVPDLYQVEVTGSDLLTGSGAIAVFLAELAARTGDPRHWTAALRALDDLLDLVGDSFAYTTNTRLAGGSPVPGGFAGPGAAMYALARCGQVLGDHGLVQAAGTFIARAREAARSPKVCWDAPFGVAGLLVNALRLHAVAPTPELGELIGEVAAGALAALVDPAARMAPYAATSRLGEFTPVGPDSIAAALARTLVKAPELLDDPEPVRRALEAYRCDLSRRGGRLADRQVASARGVVLHSHAAGVTGAARGEGLTCRALVATARELVAAGDRHGAAGLFGQLAGRRARTGTWFSDRAIEDCMNLSAVDGVVAVGLLALELLDPDVESLTLLA